MVTINLGPRTVTAPHRDHANLAAGWCVITAMGDFDHQEGGQLVLWELGLVIDFPAGSSIAIPSALVTHFNVGVGTGQHRYSVTQYCSGHLCRYVDNKMATDKTLKEKGKLDVVKAGRRTVAQWIDFLPTVEINK